MGSKTKMVQEFTECMNQPIGATPRKEQAELFFLRCALINEEFRELVEALPYMWTTIDKANNKESYERGKQAVLKELMDMVYVLLGFCVTYGWDADEAFARVHESNMSKLEDGEPAKDENGKVMKGPNYKAPDLSDLVKE